MYRSILVPLDGSEFSEQALSLAVPIARSSGARLHLVHVRTSLTGAIRTEGGEWTDPEQEYLDAVAERVSDELGESVAFTLLGDDAAVLYSFRPRKAVGAALGEYAAQHGIDLVVMTTHGRGGLNRVWLGSTADSLVRHLAVPILLVRPSPTAPKPPAMPATRIGHILIPLDGSRRAEAVIEHAIALGRLSAARYTLLQAISPVWTIDSYAVPSVPHFDPVVLAERVRDAEVSLAAVAERMRAEGLVAGTVVMPAIDAATAIDDFVRANRVDLIALATRGLGGGSRLLLGSVTDKVVRASDRPVLVLNTGAVEAAKEERAREAAAILPHGSTAY